MHTLWLWQLFANHAVCCVDYGHLGPQKRCASERNKSSSRCNPSAVRQPLLHEGKQTLLHRVNKGTRQPSISNNSLPPHVNLAQSPAGDVRCLLWAAGGRGHGIHHDSLQAGVSGGLPLFQGPCKVRKPPFVFPSLYLRTSVVAVIHYTIVLDI